MIRQGFVSNSSSSSFIVYYPKESKNYKESSYYKELWKSPKPVESADVCTLPFMDAQIHFGWTFKRFRNIKDKINYCLLQAIDLSIALKTFSFNPYEAVLGVVGNLESDEKVSPFGILVKALHKIHKKYRDNDSKIFNIEFDWNALFDFSVYDTMKCIFIDGNSYIGEWSSSFPNNEIFFNSDKMVEFLLDEDYYIQGGNDNSWNGEWDESLKLIRDPYGWLGDIDEDEAFFEEDELED